jgi:protein-S-isoprenylcysteine O-methyltransferase Ste14
VIGGFAATSGPGLVAAAGWITIFLGPVIHRRTRTSGGRRRIASVPGLVLHYAAIVLPFLAPAPDPSSLRVGVALIGAIGGAWLFHAAVRGLGAHWSLVARVSARHRLVTTGPYAIVRHPIYLATLLHLLATSIACGGPALVLATMSLGALGTVLRVRAEDELLRETFGRRWEAYSSAVPALLPGAPRVPRSRPAPGRVAR